MRQNNIVNLLKIQREPKKRLHIKHILISLLCFAYPFSVVVSQVAVTTGGNTASGTGGSISSTIGQVVCSTSTGSTGSAIAGVQQPYEISVISGLKEAEKINLVFSVYPNPSTDFITLKTEDYKNSLICLLYDNAGKLLDSKKVTGNETTLSMKNYAPAIYFLKVKQGKEFGSSKEIKTFKIIKH